MKIMTIVAPRKWIWRIKNIAMMTIDGVLNQEAVGAQPHSHLKNHPPPQVAGAQSHSPHLKNQPLPMILMILMIPAVARIAKILMFLEKQRLLIIYMVVVVSRVVLHRETQH